jgi:5,10-methylenetetrahydrofolate reductase
LYQADENKVIELGIEFGTQLCRDLIAVGVVGLHIYTLNLEIVTNGILRNLGLFKE